MRDKLKVVVIDDDAGACLLVKRILEKTKQYRVITITDPLKASALVQREKPDLLLLDNVMPGIKGSKLVKTFRENPKTKNTPIIMLTGKGEMVYSEEKDNFEWQPNTPLVGQRGDLEEQKSPKNIREAYGVDDYLSKPLNSRVLLSAIEEILIAKRKREELEEWKKFNT